jgi:hypothetical protein
VVLFDADCMFNLLLVLGNAVEVVLASTVVVVLLIRTCACADPSVLVYMVVPSTTVGCWSMRIGEARGVI